MELHACGSVHKDAPCALNVPDQGRALKRPAVALCKLANMSPTAGTMDILIEDPITPCLGLCGLASVDAMLSSLVVTREGMARE